MKMTIVDLIKLTKKARNQSIKMQNRLFLYWGAMLCVVFAAILVILSFQGVFSDTEEKVSQVLTLQQQNTYSRIFEQFDYLTSHGISLSEKTSEVISDVIFNEPISVLNDSPEKIKEIESNLYKGLNTILYSSPCNGAFVILNATINTAVPDSQSSKAGLFIRFANLSSNNASYQDVILFRGIAEVARENEIELHNRWKLEFDSETLPGYEKAISFSGSRVADGCFWTKKMSLPETWENTVLLMVPVLSNSGSVYGICGVEISELYFKLSYPTVQSDFGNMVTVFAPIKGDELMVTEGMLGSIRGTNIRNTENFVIKEGENFNEYIGRDSTFLGIHQETDIKLEDGSKIYAVTLIPQEYYLKENAANKTIWIISTVALFIGTLVFSIFLSKNFVKPIVNSFEAIRENNVDETKKSGISEIDSLLLLIKKKGIGKGNNSLPSDVEELFAEFAKRAETLTPTERSIIKFYADGKEINEIPELCYISINTVRKHNANIYKKLEVGSKEELMLYVELFRRCGRLDELL